MYTVYIYLKVTHVLEIKCLFCIQLVGISAQQLQAGSKITIIRSSKLKKHLVLFIRFLKSKNAFVRMKE